MKTQLFRNIVRYLFNQKINYLHKIQNLTSYQRIAMGTSSSNPFSKDLENFTIQKEDSENCSSYIRHIKSLEQFMIKETSYNDQKQFDKKLEIYQTRKKMEKSQHLTTLVRLQTIKEDNLCSHFYKMFTMWEYPHRTLRQEIDDRILHNQRFQEKQLWSILASCILGLSHLQRNGIKHETLQSNTILLGTQGFLKITDPLSLSIRTNFQTMYNDRKMKDIYLSPQQGAQLTANNYFMPSSPYKSDVFTIAIILLECGLLKSQNNCYREDGARIDWGVISQNLNQFSKHYQQALRSAIQAMLRRDHRQRPDWLDLQKHVKKIQSEEDSIDIDITQFKNKKQNSIPQKSNQKTFSNFQKASHNKSQEVYYGRRTYSDYQSVPNYNYTTPILHNITHTQNNYISNQNHRVPLNVYSTRNCEYSHNPTIALHEKNIYHNYNTNSETKNILQERCNQFKFSQHIPEQNYISCSNYYQTGIPNNNQNRHQFLLNSKKTPENIYYRSNYHKLHSNAHQKSEQKYQKGYCQSTKFYNSSQEKNKQNKISFPHEQTYYHQSKKQTYESQLLKNKYSNIPYRTTISNYQSLQSSNNAIKNTLHNLNQERTVNISVSNPDKQQCIQSKVIDSPLKQNDEKVIVNLDSARLDHSNSMKSSVVPNVYQQSEGEDYKNSMNILNNGQPNSLQSLEYIVEKFEQGSRYEGTKLNGMRHGQGKFYYQDGGLYDGQWSKNRMHGYGCLYYQSGKIAYQGYWNCDQFEGKGKLYNQSSYTFEQPFDYTNFDMIDEFWITYQGQFVEDLKKGKGKMTLSNGEYFIGTFDSDMINGQGQYYCLDGKIINGYWEKNILTFERCQ